MNEERCEEAGMIYFKDWTLFQRGALPAMQYDHLSCLLQVQGLFPEGYDWVLLVQAGEAMNLIASIPSVEEHPDYSKDQKSLAEHYKALLQTHDCSALVQLIKNIYCKNRELNEKGKTSGKTDQQYMKQAETLLHEELSVALGISFDEMPAYIRKQVEAM